MKKGFDRYKDPEEMTPEELAELERLLRAERAYIAEHVDERLLRIMEDRFMTHLPSYQKKRDGSYDPLDAMRRDANREVILWLREEIKTYKLEHDND